MNASADIIISKLLKFGFDGSWKDQSRNQSDRGQKNYFQIFIGIFLWPPENFTQKIPSHNSYFFIVTWDPELKFNIRGLHQNRAGRFFGSLKLSLFWWSNRPSHFWHMTAFSVWISGIFLLKESNLNQSWDKFCIISRPLDNSITSVEQILKTLPKILQNADFDFYENFL